MFSIWKGYKTKIGTIGLMLISVAYTVNQFHPLPAEVLTLAGNMKEFFMGLTGIGLAGKIMQK